MLLYPKEQALFYFMLTWKAREAHRKALPSTSQLAHMNMETLLPSSVYRELLFRCLEPITFGLCWLNFVHFVNFKPARNKQNSIKEMRLGPNLTQRSLNRYFEQVKDAVWHVLEKTCCQIANIWRRMCLMSLFRTSWIVRNMLSYPVS